MDERKETQLSADVSSSRSGDSNQGESNALRTIRRRLWLLLFRAFGIVVLLILIFTLSVTLIFLGLRTNLNPFYQSPVAYLLEAYYHGHGNWEGVDGLFSGENAFVLPYLQREWNRTVLLDQDYRIVVDHGQTTSSRIGQVYQERSGVNSEQMVIDGQLVGILVLERTLLNTPFGLMIEILPPIGAISLVLGILTLVIGLLLMRRVVHPLSEVIAAAGAVSKGDFSARVPLHRHRDDLYALSESFNQMAGSLERSDQQRREMLADIAHELRTPLTILRGRLEGIVDGVYPHDEAHIATALEEVYLLDRLVNDLRTLTQAEARQLPLEVRSFDLYELAEKVVATFDPEAKELGLSLDLAPSQEQNHLVMGDSQRVEQVIGNLVGNALQYVPEGGVIEVRIGLDEKMSRLMVIDNGPGVADADLEFLFDRFWRAERSRCRDTGGAGLGLAIAKQLVEAMGGQIGARNVEIGGLQVWFTLPAA